MATTTDYDAPRTTLTAGDNLVVLRAQRGSPDTAAIDADENYLGEIFEAPGSDLLDEEFTGAVVPMMSDEFQCTRCFLVWHRSQQATAGYAVCRDCN